MMLIAPLPMPLLNEPPIELPRRPGAVFPEELFDVAPLLLPVKASSRTQICMLPPTTVGASS